MGIRLAMNLGSRTRAQSGESAHSRGCGKHRQMLSDSLSLFSLVFDILVVGAVNETYFVVLGGNSQRSANLLVVSRLLTTLPLGKRSQLHAR